MLKCQPVRPRPTLPSVLHNRYTASVEHSGSPSLCCRRLNPAASPEPGKLPGQSARVRERLTVCIFTSLHCAFQGQKTAQIRELRKMP